MTNKNDLHCPNGEESCPIFSEIEELRREVTTLSTQVRTDFLTGLFNKQHLLFSLEQEIERTTRTRMPTTLILIDGDHFKSINDNHGHVVGDKVIAHLSKLIQDTVRKIDIPCRYGGEEFAIVLPGTATLVGVQVAERIRNYIAKSPLNISSNASIEITVSIGVGTLYPDSKWSPEEFITIVDQQLYQAKEQGRDRVCYVTHKLTDDTTVSAEEKDALFGPSGSNS